ncbi:MAG: sugar-binding protein [Candidatus Promineifilaceae bacterium]
MLWFRHQLKKKEVWISLSVLSLLLLYAMGLMSLLIWLSLTGRIGGNSADIIVANKYTPPVTEPLIGQQPNEEALSREGLVRTKFVETPFTIDADLEGWAELNTTSSAYQVYAADSWDGTNDGAAFWRTAWDDDYFYVSAIVVDDVHVQGAESAVYRGDVLELQIDTNVDADRISPRTFTLVLSPGDFDTIPAFAACLRGTTTGKMRAIAQHSTKIAVIKTETGYVLEAAIPWGDLGAKPSASWKARIALSLHDTDSAEHLRAEIIQSSVTERHAEKPESWGILLLTD